MEPRSGEAVPTVRNRRMTDSPVRVVVRAVSILDCFVGARGSLGIAEIARQTNLSKSTVHHVVATLVDTGMLSADVIKGRYRLGPKIAQFGHAFAESTALRDVALQSMHELRDLSGETVTLHIRIGDERVILAQVESLQGVRRVLTVGAARPLWLGAAGVVLMSGLSDAEVREILARASPKKLTDRTVTDMNETFALVERARKEGYSTLSEQMERDVGAIALPIRDHTGSVPGCVLISGPLTRWNPSSTIPQLPEIEAIVTAVSRRLGWRGGENRPR